MNGPVTVGGLGGALAAGAAASTPVLVLTGIVIFALIGVACWVIANRRRTENTVAIITAARGQPRLPCPTTTNGADHA